MTELSCVRSSVAHLSEFLLQLHLSYWRANLGMLVLGILSACNKLFVILVSTVYNAQGSRKNTVYFGCGSRQQKTFGLRPILSVVVAWCVCGRVIASLHVLYTVSAREVSKLIQLIRDVVRSRAKRDNATSNDNDKKNFTRYK
jgi:hypothetical protein